MELQLALADLVLQRKIFHIKSKICAHFLNMHMQTMGKVNHLLLLDRFYKKIDLIQIGH